MPLLSPAARPAVLARPGPEARRDVRRWLPAAGFLASAVFAALVALLSDEPVHRLWGGWAAAGYGLAALIACWPGWPASSPEAAVAQRARARAAAVAVALAGAVLVPLGTMAAAGRGMPEAGVTERAAALLLQHGSPYLPAARLAGHGFLAYNPYLPAMTVFGLPHAVFGPGLLTDPRLWAGLAFAAASLAAFRVAGLPGRACAPPRHRGAGRHPGHRVPAGGQRQ